MKYANPMTNAHVVLPLGFANLVNLLSQTANAVVALRLVFTSLVNLLSLTANVVVALRLVFTNLVNHLSLFQLLVRASVMVIQLGLVVDGGGTLGTCHPPRLRKGAVVHNGSHAEAGGMTCAKGLSL
jgi:hypothetical protein